MAVDAHQRLVGIAPKQMRANSTDRERIDTVVIGADPRIDLQSVAKIERHAQRADAIERTAVIGKSPEIEAILLYRQLAVDAGYSRQRCFGGWRGRFVDFRQVRALRAARHD